MHLRNKAEAGGRGGTADDVGVVSQLTEQLRKMLGVIVVVCAACGLNLSEANTEIMCLRTWGMPESTAIFSVGAAGQVYNQTNEFVYSGGNVNHNADQFIEVNRRIRTAWCRFRKYTLELYDRPSVPLKLKVRMLRAEVFETMLSLRLRHVEPTRVPLQHAAPSPPQLPTRCIDWRKNNHTDHLISYLDMLIKTRSESIEATTRRRWILFAGFVAHMEGTRLPKCVMSEKW